MADHFWPPVFLFTDCEGETKYGTPTKEDSYVTEVLLVCYESEPWCFRVHDYYDKGPVIESPLIKEILNSLPGSYVEDDALFIGGFQNMVLLKMMFG